MIGAMPVCLKCRHYHKGEAQEGFTCTAFPDGIPDAIYEGENNHTRPYPGDNGIQFEPLKQQPEKEKPG